MSNIGVTSGPLAGRRPGWCEQITNKCTSSSSSSSVDALLVGGFSVQHTFHCAQCLHQRFSSATRSSMMAW